MATVATRRERELEQLRAQVRADLRRELDERLLELRQYVDGELDELTQRVDGIHTRALRALTDEIGRVRQ